MPLCTVVDQRHYVDGISAYCIPLPPDYNSCSSSPPPYHVIFLDTNKDRRPSPAELQLPQDLPSYEECVSNKSRTPRGPAEDSPVPVEGIEYSGRVGVDVTDGRTRDNWMEIYWEWIEQTQEAKHNITTLYRGTVGASKCPHSSSEIKRYSTERTWRKEGLRVKGEEQMKAIRDKTRERDRQMRERRREADRQRQERARERQRKGETKNSRYRHSLPVLFLRRTKGTDEWLTWNDYSEQIKRQ